MDIGEVVDINDVDYVCRASGGNIIVLEKAKKISGIKPNNLRKKDLDYLQQITYDDLDELRNYTVNTYGAALTYLIYILVEYVGFKKAELAKRLGINNATVTNSINQVLSKPSKINRADDLAKSVGYWKYRQLQDFKN